MTPKQIPGYADYYYVYNHSRYGINTDADIIDLKHPDKSFKPFLNNGGYATISLTDDNGHHHFVLVHRLMMLTFRHPGEEMLSKLTVDHLDGNKTNNCLSNLEWVSTQENTLRAGESGLSTKCLPIKTQHIKTGEIHIFPSATAAGKHFGLHKDTILFRAQHSDRFYNGFQFSFVNPDQRQHNKNCAKKSGGTKVVYVRNLFTNEVREYPTMQAAAKAMKMSAKTLCQNPHYRDYYKQPVVPTGFQFKLKDDPKPWRDCDYWGELSVISRLTKVVECYDPSTEKITRYTSLRLAAEASGCHVTTVLSYIQDNRKDQQGREWGYYPQITRRHLTTSPAS